MGFLKALGHVVGSVFHGLGQVYQGIFISEVQDYYSLNRDTNPAILERCLYDETRQRRLHAACVFSLAYQGHVSKAVEWARARGFSKSLFQGCTEMNSLNSEMKLAAQRIVDSYDTDN